MGRYLLDNDLETGKTDHLLERDGQYVIETIQDAQDVVDYNARMAAHLDKKQDWWFIGSIPLNICQQWAQESGTKVFTKAWQAYAKKQIQMPEYRKLNPNNIKL